MEVVQPNYAVIHEELTGDEDYSPEGVLEEVGSYLDRSVNEMMDDPDTTVTGYLDAAFHEIGEPKFDPAMAYEPEGFIEKVDVDEENGVFYVHGNGDVHRYWVPYMENRTMCVFTDHFVSGSEPLEGVRFALDGGVEDVPEIPGNPQVTHDIATIYDAVENKVADEWSLSHLGGEVSGGDRGFDVDTSLIQNDLLSLQEEDPELFEQTMRKIERIADDPISQSEKIIEGERVYKVNRIHRLTGNIVSMDREEVKLKRMGHRKDLYSEEVDH